MNSIDTVAVQEIKSKSDEIKSVYKSKLYIFNFVALCCLGFFSGVIAILHFVSAVLSLFGAGTIALSKVAPFAGKGLGYVLILGLYVVAIYILITSAGSGIKIIKKALHKKKLYREDIIETAIFFGASLLVSVCITLIFAFSNAEGFLGIPANLSQCLSYLAIAGIYGLILTAAIFGVISSVKLMKGTSSDGIEDIKKIGKVPALLRLISIFKCADCAIIGFILFMPVIAYPHTKNPVDVKGIFTSLGLSRLYNGIAGGIYDLVARIYHSIIMGVFSVIEAICNGVGLGKMYVNLDVPRIAEHLAGPSIILAFVALIVIALGVARLLMFNSYRKYYSMIDNVFENENYVAEKKAPKILPIIFTSFYGIGAILMFINVSIFTGLYCLAMAVYIISSSLLFKDIHKHIGE